VEIGKRVIEREARRFDISLKRFSDDDFVRVGRDYGLLKADDVFAAVGYGKISARQILGRLLPADQRTPEQAGLFSNAVKRLIHRRDGNPILVRGFDDLMVYRAGCCNPVHGEPIVGYITRGKGVAVHSEQCSNVQNLLYEADRKIDVEWASKVTDVQPVKLLIHTDDRAGMLNDITAVISESGSNIKQAGAQTHDGNAVIDVVMDISDLKQLERIVAGLKKIAGVREVQRQPRL
jgi:GTP pyrophosphokinase